MKKNKLHNERNTARPEVHRVSVIFSINCYDSSIKIDSSGLIINQPDYEENLSQPWWLFITPKYNTIHPFCISCQKDVAIDPHEWLETWEKRAQPAYIPMWMALETWQMCSHSTQCSHPNLIIPAWTHSHSHGVLHGIIYTQSWLGHMLVHLPNIHRCIFGVDSSAFLTTDEFPCESDFAL